MKRVFLYVLLLLLLLPVFLLPVGASDAEEFVFERYDMPALLHDYPFAPGYPFEGAEFLAFVYPGSLPEGEYTISFSPDYIQNPEGSTVIQFLSCDPFFVVYEDSAEYGPHCFQNIKISITDGWFVDSFDLYLMIVLDDYSFDEPFTYVFLGSYDETQEFIHVLDSITFHKTKTSSELAVLAINGSLQENPNLLFTHLLSVLLVALPVLVSFISIRKAISWVRSKVSGA